MPANWQLGSIIRRTEAHRWSEGWDTVEVFEDGGASYLFLMKSQGSSSSGKNVHIHELTQPGTIGPRIDSHKWSQGWTSATFYAAGGATYLLLLKTAGFSSIDRNVHIHRMQGDGTVGSRVADYRWTEGWTTVETFRAGETTYLLLLKSKGLSAAGRNVHIHEISSNGTVGPRKATFRWTEGWTSAEFFHTAGGSYLFLLKKQGQSASGNNVHIHRLSNSAPFVGPRVVDYSWSEGWDNVELHAAADSSTYLFLLKSGDGEMHLHHMRADGTVGTRVISRSELPDYYSGAGDTLSRFPLRWSPQWSVARFFKAGDQSRLFLLKTQGLTGSNKNVHLHDFTPFEPVGPMVGATTPTSARIWLGVPGGRPVTASVHVTIGGVEKVFPFDFEYPAPAEDYYNPGVAVVADLEPRTRYPYRVTLNGEEIASGAFRTAPDDVGERGFRVAVVSCMHEDEEQIAWDHLQPRLIGEDGTPSLLLLLGDNCYPNTTNRGNIWEAHLKQRSNAAFPDVLRSVPTYAIWDDHDFGPNNSTGADREHEQHKAYHDRRVDNRKSSMKAFREVFAHPAYGGSTGAYYTFRWGDVDFFALDVRYFRHQRTLPTDDPDKELLGALGSGGTPSGPQWRWLENALDQSSARFKVILSGCTLRSGGSAWEHYERQYAHLLTLLNAAEGVVFLSGDIHKLRYQAAGRPSGLSSGPQTIDFPELTSSGVGHSFSEDFLHSNGFLILEFNELNSQLTAKFYDKLGNQRTDSGLETVVINA